MPHKPLPKFRAHGVSRENADAQRMTINVQKAAGAQTPQRGSWWVGTDPRDFTAYASVMVVPVPERQSPIYQWRDNND